MATVRREMWMVVNTNRHWIYGVDFTRKASIAEFMEDWQGISTWKKKRKEGWQCVKAKISYPSPHRSPGHE